jgi:hypothetical protein
MYEGLKIVLAIVQPGERIAGPIKLRKVEFVVSWKEVTVVLIVLHGDGEEVPHPAIPPWADGRPSGPHPGSRPQRRHWSISLQPMKLLKIPFIMPCVSLMD